MPIYDSKTLKPFYDLFKLYSEIRSGGGIIDSIVVDSNSKNDLILSKQDGITVLSKKFLNQYNPDKINGELFWKTILKVYPYFPIVRDKNLRNKHQLHKESLKIHRPILDYILPQLDKNFKMLEIGPGYGSVRNFVKRKYGLNNYYAIDINPLYKCEKLFKCDGKSIPDNIPNELDLIYSVNVFQHLSLKQRNSYFEQIYKKLKPGGIFIFCMFCCNENKNFELEKNKKLFAYRDKKDNIYVSFYNQFTLVENSSDVTNKLYKKFNFTAVQNTVLDLNSNLFTCMK